MEKHWKKWQIEYLILKYGKDTSNEIAEYIKKSPSSVRAKANSLGLKSNLSQSKETRAKINYSNQKHFSPLIFEKKKELAYIIGVLNGDGSLSNRAIRLSVKDKEFADYYSDVIERWCGERPKRYIEKYYRYTKNEMYVCNLHSKQLTEYMAKFYISKKGDEALNNIKAFLNEDKELELNFINGFFDSEGCASRPSFSNSNIYLLEFIMNILTKHGIISHLKIGHKAYINKHHFANGKIGFHKSEPNSALYLSTDKTNLNNFINLVMPTIKRKADILRNWCKVGNTSLNHREDFSSNLKFRINFTEVTNSTDKKMFNDFLQKNHSYKKKSARYGRKIDFLIKIDNKLIGVIGVSGAFLLQGTRNRFISWDKKQRLKNMNKVIDNYRFCLNKNNKIPNLASQVLSKFIKIIKRRWFEKYGVKPMLIETYVSCNMKKGGKTYLASNWKYIGMTKGLNIKRENGKYINMGQQDKKLVFILPLHKLWKKALTGINGHQS